MLAAKSIVKYKRKCEDLDDNNVKYYVVQMSSRPDRVENVNIQEQKLGKKINRFEAILGKDNEEYAYLIGRDTTIEHIRTPGELGCFLSHYELIKKIMNEDSRSGYSVIFEDDFDLVSENTDEIINHYIEMLKMNHRYFDLLFLGRCSVNSNPVYKDSLYEIVNLNDDIVIMCTHGYIINNRNIEKIFKLIDEEIDIVIDHKYNQLTKSGQLKTYLLDPPIVYQQYETIPTTIENH